MSEGNSGDGLTGAEKTAIFVELAKIGERQEAGAHRMNNVAMQLDGFINLMDKKIEGLAVKRDVDDDLAVLRERTKESFASVKEDVARVDRRIDTLEGTVSMLFRSAAAFVVSLAGGIYAIGRKIGIVP